MNGIKLILVILALIIVVTGIVIVIVPVDPNDEITCYPDCRLWVLGNANNDDYIDENDILYVNNLLYSDNTYQYCDEYMSDANYDGLINEDDIAYIQGLINGTENNLWYVNVDLEISHFVRAPTINVVPIHTPMMEMMVVINQSMIVASDDTVTDKYYKQFRDVIPDDFPSVGSPWSIDAERVADLYNIYGDLVIVCGTSDYYSPELESQVEPLGIQVIRLPSWENGNVVHGLITLSYLLGETDSVSEYVLWHDHLLGTIESVVSTIPDEDRVKLIMLYAASEDNDEVRGPGTGEYENSIFCGADNLAWYFEDVNVNWYTVLYSTEDIVALSQNENLQMIIMQFNGPYNAEDGYAEEFYYTCVNRFAPYMDVDMCVFGWDCAVSTSYVISMLMYAYWMYPDQFENRIDPLSEYQYYLNNFLGYTTWDVDDMEIWYSYLDE